VGFIGLPIEGGSTWRVVACFLFAYYLNNAHAHLEIKLQVTTSIPAATQTKGVGWF